MDDAAAMEIREAAENLASQIGEMMFLRDVRSFQRAPIHVLEKNLDFAVVIEHIVALDHIGIVNVAKDLDLTAHLKPNRVLVVAVNDLESIDSAGGTVNHFVHSTSASTSDSTDSLKVGEAERLMLLRLRMRMRMRMSLRRSVSVVELTGGRRSRVRGRRRQRERHGQRRVVPLRKRKG